MAIRYLDTGFFKSPFLRGLEGSLKSLYLYIITDCDGAGIWVKDLDIANIYIDAKVTEKQFDECFIKTGKAVQVDTGKFFFPDFIEHQYPSGLSEKNPAHKNFILTLKKYDLVNKDLTVKFKGSSKGLQRDSEVPQVIVKVIDNVTVIGKGAGKTIKTPELILPFDSEEFKNAWSDMMTLKKWKSKPVKALQGNLQELAKFTEQEAIQILKHHFNAGYQGLFPESALKAKKTGFSNPDRTVSKTQLLFEASQKAGEKFNSGFGN